MRPLCRHDDPGPGRGPLWPLGRHDGGAADYSGRYYPDSGDALPAEADPKVEDPPGALCLRCADDRLQCDVLRRQQRPDDPALPGAGGYRLRGLQAGFQRNHRERIRNGGRPKREYRSGEFRHHGRLCLRRRPGRHPVGQRRLSVHLSELRRAVHPLSGDDPPAGALEPADGAERGEGKEKDRRPKRGAPALQPGNPRLYPGDRDPAEYRRDAVHDPDSRRRPDPGDLLRHAELLLYCKRPGGRLYRSGAGFRGQEALRPWPRHRPGLRDDGGGGLSAEGAAGHGDDHRVQPDPGLPGRVRDPDDVRPVPAAEGRPKGSRRGLRFDY